MRIPNVLLLGVVMTASLGGCAYRFSPPRDGVLPRNAPQLRAYPEVSAQDRWLNPAICAKYCPTAN